MHRLKAVLMEVIVLSADDWRQFVLESTFYSPTADKAKLMIRHALAIIYNLANENQTNWKWFISKLIQHCSIIWLGINILSINGYAPASKRLINYDPVLHSSELNKGTINFILQVLTICIIVWTTKEWLSDWNKACGHKIS